jgi:ABC-type sulfate transport system permease component
MERIVSGISTKFGRRCRELGAVFLVVSIIPYFTFTSKTSIVIVTQADDQLQYDKEANAGRRS